LVIVVILFGATRLPEIGRGIGEAIRNFKKSTAEPPEIDVTPDKKSGESEDNSAQADSDKGNKS
jgi:sec-independent protein translocase protein TatA